MERVKKWLMSRKMGSTDAIFMKPGLENVSMDSQEPFQSDYELTSIKIKHLLERKLFQKVVDLLRELPRDYVLSCLESFPFITLNRAVPASFLIWETLLTKLKNSEEDYIPQFPYKSCDDLVMRVAWLLETKPPGMEELSHSCRRVLKCVFMQYNEVLEQLYKEHDRVDHALHTLCLHSPLGPGGPSLEQAIKEEVQASLEDYTTALECLDDLRLHDDHKTQTGSDEGVDGHKLSPGSGNGSNGSGVEGEEGDLTSKQMGAVLAPNPTQVQLHERLYQNQRVFTALRPSRRCGTLSQLMDFLRERIHGDKEVIYLFGKIRNRDPTVGKCVPVQPWLRKYQHALDLAIGALKDIEKDLEITIPRVESPMQLCTMGAVTPAGDDGGIQMVPTSSSRLRSRSNEYERLYHHRHSAAPIMDYFVTMEEEKSQVARAGPIPRRNLSVPHTHRPRSASPHKLLCVNGNGGGVGGEVLSTRTGSMKSISSTSNDSSSTNLATGTSSSVHDLHSTRDYPPSLAFTRVQSLKTHNTVQVVAGKRKKGIGVLPNSFTNLTTTSISTGSMNGHSSSGKKAKKNLFRFGSGELGQAWDRHMQVTPWEH